MASEPRTAGAGRSSLDASLIQQQRPPLVRRGTSYASQSSAQGTTRLLWRGSIATREGFKLYGIAIIAHLFSVPSSSPVAISTTNSPAPSTSFSPFEDPFSSASKAATSGADMCLGLEMLRGKDLAIVDDNDGEPLSVVQHFPNETTHSDLERRPVSHKKGKGKAQSSREVVKVETPTDVRVYVDERCTDTVEWFQDQFCREGCQGRGIKLDAGGEPIIIFAQLPEPSATTGTNSPSTSTATLDESSLPPLTLLLGRPFKPVVRKPRPDDPLPRESLFTAKLRKTASLPTAAFSKTSLAIATGGEQVAPGGGEKKKRLSTKDKTIASLMGKSAAGSDEFSATEGRHSRRVPQRRQSSIPPTITLPVPTEPGSKRPLSRSLSTSSSSATSHRLFSAASSRQGSLPPVPDAATRPFKRSRSSLPTSSASSSSMQFLSTATGSPPPLRRNSFGSQIPPSPTLSIASTSTYGGGPNGGKGGVEQVKREDEEDFGDESREMDDRVEELRQVGIKRQRSTNGIVDPFNGAGVVASGARRGAGGMKRSLSVPVGVGGARGKFLGTPTVDQVNGKEEGKMNLNDGGGSGESNAIEVRNKNTIKKFTMNRLQALGIGKDHFEFKEVFSMVTRGVGFALRSTFKTRVLSPTEREKAEDLIEVHLRLYLPDHPAFSNDPNHRALAEGSGGDYLRPVKTVEDLAIDGIHEPDDDAKDGVVPTTRVEVGLGPVKVETKERERSSDTVIGDDEDMVKQTILDRDRQREASVDEENMETQIVEKFGAETQNVVDIG